jgi:hypothetical protein
MWLNDCMEESLWGISLMYYIALVNQGVTSGCNCANRDHRTQGRVIGACMELSIEGSWSLDLEAPRSSNDILSHFVDKIHFFAGGLAVAQVVCGLCRLSYLLNMSSKYVF